MNEIVSYITALRNVLDRQSEMISTATLVEHLDDLLTFIEDLPDQAIEIVYDYGTDGMGELFERKGWN